jgi:uncharacterized damage-inducible protein DinB
MSRPILTDAFAHHSWATIQLIDACIVLDLGQLGTAVPGTYGSILDTLRHLVGSDRSYLSLLSDGRLAEIDEETMGLTALREVMEANAPAWAAVLEADLDPDRVLVRHREDGSESHAPLGIRLAQVVHHGSDHRSQVCTALTSLGIEPPAIDVWDFAWQADRLKETQASA